MDTNFITLFSEWFQATFHKEAIAIFAVQCLVFFVMAGYMAYLAWKNGEFSDLEAAKYEAMNLL
ncbi:MAG: hypothetical protein OXU45_08735 [Candidatus Melainabacteria bacterium]|nr:hypothetical protein [Candidatus Melainabacteria bacterium]